MRALSYRIVLMCLASLLTACAMQAPPYGGSLENVQKLKSSGSAGVTLGKIGFVAGPGNPAALSIRANPMHSPYEDSYNGYLAAAVKQELTLAGLLKPDSDIEISGELLKNDISAAGISTATADISARFVVKKAGVERYNQIKSAHDEWDSSFVGMVAIPRAQQRYPHVVELLLSTLYDDPDFLQALK